MSRQPTSTTGIRWVWLLPGLLSALTIFWMTSRPLRGIAPVNINWQPMRVHGPALICVLNHCPDTPRLFWFVLIDIFGNIFVFIPFGFFLAMALGTYLAARRKVWIIVLASFCLSLTIETSQLGIPSRTSDVDDLIFNTIGGIIGMTLALLLLYFQQGRTWKL